MSRTAYLHIEFKRPVPVGVELEYVGRVTSIEGRKVFLYAELLLDGVVLTTGEGLWVRLKEEDRPAAFAEAIRGTQPPAP